MKNIKIKQALGAKLKELRELRGYSCSKIEELTQKNGEQISKNYISQVERSIGGRLLSKNKFKTLLHILKPNNQLEKELWELYLFAQTPNEIIEYLNNIKDFKKFLELIKSASTDEERLLLIGLMAKMKKLEIPDFPDTMK